MNIFQEFINSYGTQILYAIFMAIAGYLGVVVKNLYQKYVNDSTKRPLLRRAYRLLSSCTRTSTVKTNTIRLLSPWPKCSTKKALLLLTLK